MRPVAELFEAVSGQIPGEVGQLFSDVAAEMAAVTGRPPQTALRMALEHQPGLLDREAQSVLLELGGCLGRYDLCGQARALGLYKLRLEHRCTELETVLRARAKATMTASVCAGLAVIVILL